MLLPSVEGQEGGKWIVIDSGMSVLHYPAGLLLYPNEVSFHFFGGTVKLSVSWF